MHRLAVPGSILAALATASCAQILGLDDPKRASDGPDAAPPGATLTLRHDTVADFAGPGTVRDGVVIEPWGALGPAPRPVGALLARGYASQLFVSPDAADWAVLAATSPAGLSYLSPGPLAIVDGVPVSAGITAPGAWTVLLEGEVWLDKGSHDWKLQADDAGFLDLGAPDAAPRRLVAADSTHTGVGHSEAAAAGWYPIRLALTQSSGGAALALTHRGPGETAFAPLPPFRLRAPAARVDGLLAQGFAGSRMTDARTLSVRAADGLTVDYGAGGPLEVGVTLTDFFSVRWSGQVRIERAARYRFHVVADEGHRVWIDGARALDNWKDESGEGDAIVALDVGWHDLAIDLRELTGTSKIALALTEPADLAGPIPVSRLRPTLVQTPGVAGLRQDLGAVAIPDNASDGVAANTVLAAPAGAVVEGIEVSAEVTHARRADLALAVQAPDGVERVLVKAGELVGGGTTIARAGDDFAGHLAAGTWKVVVRDRAAGVTGTLGEVALTVHYRGGESPVVTAAHFDSAPLDLGARAAGSEQAPGAVAIDEVTYAARAAAGSSVVVRVRTCDSAEACDGQPWSAPVTSATQPALTPRRFAQYRVELTTDGESVPSLDAIELAYRTAP